MSSIMDAFRTHWQHHHGYSPMLWKEAEGLTGEVPEKLRDNFCARSVQDAWQAYLAGRSDSAKEIVVTTDEQGNAVAVTRQDAEGQVLSIIWQKGP